jgi:hypothetical protein
MPEKHAEVEYFASAEAVDGIGQNSALEPVLSDDLADDIAAAWGQNSSLDLLPADWV